MGKRIELGTDWTSSDYDEAPELCEHGYELDCPHAVCDLRDETAAAEQIADRIAQLVENDPVIAVLISTVLDFTGPCAHVQAKREEYRGQLVLRAQIADRLAELVERDQSLTELCALRDAADAEDVDA